MALEGTLKDFGLADILQLIGIQRKTGVLTLENTEDVVTVKFFEGQVVGADTRLRNLEDLLGSVMVRTGRITEAQLQESLRIQKATLQRLGYILIKSGFVSEEALRDALLAQVTQIVYRLFRWRDGRYHFDALDHVEYDQENFTPINADTILMEGARMIDEWPIIERRIRSGQTIFRKTAAAKQLEKPVESIVDADLDRGSGSLAGRADAEGEIQLSPDEREVLRMVDGKTTVQDVAERSSLGEFDTYRILYECLNRNLIEEVHAALLPGAIVASATAPGIARIVVPVVLLALSAAAVLTQAYNPLTPWRTKAVTETTERLRTFAGRSRVENLDRAIRAFYLNHCAIPDRLAVLRDARYVGPVDLLDPWGRPYALQVGPDGYRITAVDSTGESVEELSVRHVFTPAQRMTLQGQAQADDNRPRRES